MRGSRIRLLIVVLVAFAFVGGACLIRSRRYDPGPPPGHVKHKKQKKHGDRDHRH